MSEEAGPPTSELEQLRIENGGGAAGDQNPPSPQPSTPTKPGSFEEAFKTFSKFGDAKSDGKHITLSQSDKWFKQAKVIDAKKITTADTAIHFKKFKAVKMGIADYKKFLEDLAKAKKIDLDEVKAKLANCGQPGVTGPGLNKTTETVNRLTDASKYTGTHKQRFDQTGKGKGIAGRKDFVDSSGYVSGYQNRDSFGKPQQQ